MMRVQHQTYVMGKLQRQISSSPNDDETWNNNFIGQDSVQELSRTAAVPDSYIRHEEERPSECLDSDSSFPQISMLNLQSSNQQTRQEELDKLEKACKEWGFFNLIDHGIPHRLIDRIKEAAREFYDLPLDEKVKYKPKRADPQGYGSSYVMDENNKLDWCDLLSLIINPRSARDPSVWPSVPSDFKDIVERYSDHVDKTARDVLKLIAETLGLRDDYFEERFGEDRLMVMRMNLYPVCPRPDLVMGLSPHADGTGITLLLQDDQCVGLHLLKDGSWVSVTPVPYALVVSVGDLVEVMSNGKYKSVQHRAVANSQTARMSIVAFYSPGQDKEISPADTLVKEDGEAFYKSFVHGDYISYYTSHPLRGKDPLQSFAKIKESERKETA